MPLNSEDQQIPQYAMPNAAVVFARDMHSYFEDCGCSGVAVGGVARYASLAFGAPEIRYVFVGRTVLPKFEGVREDRLVALQAQAPYLAQVALQLFQAMGNVVWWCDREELDDLQSLGIELDAFRQWIVTAESMLEVRGLKLVQQANRVTQKEGQLSFDLPRSGDRGRNLAVVVIYDPQSGTSFESAPLYERRLNAYLPLVKTHAEARERISSILSNLPGDRAVATVVRRRVTAEAAESVELKGVVERVSIANAHFPRLDGSTSSLASIQGALAASWQDCAPCHKHAYERWMSSKHAGAYETLLKVGKAGDARCLPCHAESFNKDLSVSSRAAAVTCRSCHDGERPAFMVCQDCHTPLTDPKRHYLKGLTTICCTEDSRLVEGSSGNCRR